MFQEKGRAKTLLNSFPPEGVIFSSCSAGLFSHSKTCCLNFPTPDESHPRKPKKNQTKLYKKWAKPHPLMTNKPKKNPNKSPHSHPEASVRCSAASTSGSSFLSASRQSWQENQASENEHGSNGKSPNFWRYIFKTMVVFPLSSYNLGFPGCFGY